MGVEEQQTQVLRAVLSFSVSMKMEKKTQINIENKCANGQ